MCPGMACASLVKVGNRWGGGYVGYLHDVNQTAGPDPDPADRWSFLPDEEVLLLAGGTPEPPAIVDVGARRDPARVGDESTDQLRAVRTAAFDSVADVVDHHPAVPGTDERDPAADERVVDAVVRRNGHACHQFDRVSRRGIPRRRGLPVAGHRDHYRT